MNEMKFPEKIGYAALAEDFRQTVNGSTCPRHGMIDDAHYIAKCEHFQELAGCAKTTSESHVHNEFIADGVIRSMGFNVPESREYRTRDTGALVRLSRFVEDTVPLAVAWAKGDGTARYKIRNAVIEAYPLQAMIAGIDTFQNDNVLVTKDGRLWFVDNGASLGWRARGGKNDRFWERADPNDRDWGYLSLRYHPNQRLLREILDGVSDQRLWEAAAMFDVRRFLDTLPRGEYDECDFESLAGYVKAVVEEAVRRVLAAHNSGLSDFKFRFYKGEKENPWDTSKEETFKQGHFWLFESFCANMGIAGMLRCRDCIPDCVMDADVSYAEKLIAGGMYFSADSFMPEKALLEYFKYDPFPVDLPVHPSECT